jgi:antiviral helicase SKI2
MASLEGNGDVSVPPRRQPSFDQVKTSLEADFLSPPTSFSAEWLNKLQHRWDEQIDYTEITQLAPTQSRTVTRFTREGLEGRVTGYREVTVPAASANAKNSTSILRRPANRADFVRGAAGFFPFAPGGLDGVDAIQAFEDEAALEADAHPRQKSGGLNRIINFGSSDGLLEIPPGFSRGMTFVDKKSKEAAAEAEEVENTLQEPLDASSPAVNGGFNGEIPSSGTASPIDGLLEEEVDETDLDDLDDLLPVEFPSLEPHGQLLASSSSKGGREWAHVVDVNKDIPNFHELVPEMARTWPFELDVFQKEAVYHLENGDSVFVAAHTSAGKTVVAEYAISLAAKHMTKAIYTSPIKALSNQKFRDFKSVFDDVGILTGDVQINPEASCLIMTTEILRSMLYRGADLIRDVEFVIFDEVHYVSDAERGVVWEEVIIMLPDHVNVVLLSATVPNTFEFASWVGRTKKKDIYVISTAKRPVPLEHYLWSGKEMHKIVDSNKKFLEKGWKEANDIMSGRDKIKEQTADGGSSRGDATSTRGPIAQRGGRGGQQQRGGNQRGGNQRGGNQRGGSQQRGQSSNRGQGNIARTGRGGGRTSAAQDRNVWVHLVHHLRKENLLPACIFVFSKKRCEENADSLSNQDFCTAAEKSQIHMIVEKSIARLKPDDRIIPQILKIKEKLSRGVAVHHGGLLPIVKEIVEILFARTLVKVLFATETFAMGLNLPTRTVAFSGFKKFDSKEFRNLTPGEYTQMAGRAGRRGIDTVGTVILVTQGRNEAPSVTELRAMMIAQPTKLKSQFRLHYNMILNLMRVEALKIEEMIKRSFSENATQALLPQHEKDISGNQARLEKIKREPCDICDVDLEAFHDAAIDYEKLTQELHGLTLNTPVGRRMWSARRLIVYKRDQLRSVGVLVEDGAKGGSLKVLDISNLDRKLQPSDALPYLPDLKFRHMFAPLPTDAEHVKWKLISVPVEDVECVTRTVLKLKGPQWYIKVAKIQKQIAEEEFPKRYSSWYTRDWDEVDWSSDTALAVRELITHREKFVPIFQHATCLDCPNFLRHFEMQHAEWLVKTQIQNIMHQMSDQNLALLPDYNQRVEVLKDLGFIDPESRVLLKGKVACEIHSADELVLTELILENVLADFEPAEIVALLSSFVFQEKSDVDPYNDLTSSLQRGIDAIRAISKRVNDVQTLHQVILSSDDADFEVQPRFGLVAVVYNWAEGMGFKEIMEYTDVMEGTIVRVVTRLDETCREVMSAARLIGDPGLYAKMEKAREMIRRDVVFTASLYM